MAFFNLRVPGQSTSSASSETLQTTPAESLEVLRKRARHRLMGAVVLVLAAVIGFPLLFDTQPRPVSVDTPIVIPDRNALPSTAPVAAPAAAPAPVTSVAGVVSPAPATTGASAVGPLPPAGVLDANEEVVSATPRPAEKAPRSEAPQVAAAKAGDFKVDFGKTAGTVPPAPEAKLDNKNPAAAKPAPVKPEVKPEAKVETKVVVAAEKAHDKSHDDAAKARALLDGKDPAATAKPGEERLVIQVGAYTDAAKVREARQKLEAAGFKTYTQVIDSKDGKRTRVRVGPFESKAEADKSAQKIRKLQLDTAILKL
jgi:DedD protein